MGRIIPSPAFAANTTILAAFALALAACGERDVAYYKAEAVERTQMLRKCLAQGDDSQECRNAAQAQFEIDGIPAENGRAVIRRK